MLKWCINVYTQKQNVRLTQQQIMNCTFYPKWRITQSAKTFVNIHLVTYRYGARGGEDVPHIFYCTFD